MAFRWLVLALLVAAAVSFALYAITGRPRFRQLGLQIFKWTVLAAFVFFGILIVTRVI
jgi:hypothetical protein